VAAELEAIVVAADGFDPEDLFPEFGDVRLRRPGRGLRRYRSPSVPGFSVVQGNPAKVVARSEKAPARADYDAFSKGLTAAK
jgi:hypothetical protein